MNNSLLEVTTSGQTGTTLMEQEVKKGAVASEDSMSPAQRSIVICMLVIFSVTGTVGNALAIYVFASLKQKLLRTNSLEAAGPHISRRFDKRLTSTVFILTLAGTDFVTCLITIPFTIYMEYVNHYASTDAVCKIFTFLTTTTVPFSAVVIMAIAVDRYMCICHPFNHWMTIQRARIIIFSLGLVIFMFGGIICMHHSIYFPMPTNVSNASFVLDANHTPPIYNYDAFLLNSSTNVVDDVAYINNINIDNSYNYNNNSSSSNASWLQPSGPSKRSAVMNNRQCDIRWDYINADFMSIIRSLYTAIFAVSCIIVLVLYSLIYRYVIYQRKKKLRIKSAQCCLLWNATSVETHHEAVEMTQDIELSNVNGDRYNARHNSTDDTNDSHNNVAARKCSISKARIERMRVANIKTAFTLFIVTLVFIIAFLPAWLMALEAITMQVILFYIHFIYNVSNPFIYAFLNQNFKAELRRIARCGKR